MTTYNNTDVRRSLIIQNLVLLQASLYSHLPGNLHHHVPTNHAKTGGSPNTLLYFFSRLHEAPTLAASNSAILHGKVRLFVHIQHILCLHRNQQSRNSGLLTIEICWFSLVGSTSLSRLSHHRQHYWCVLLHLDLPNGAGLRLVQTTSSWRDKNTLRDCGQK